MSCDINVLLLVVCQLFRRVVPIVYLSDATKGRHW
jgi:hypothetical protein